MSDYIKKLAQQAGMEKDTFTFSLYALDEVTK